MPAVFFICPAPYPEPRSPRVRAGCGEESSAPARRPALSSSRRWRPRTRHSAGSASGRVTLAATRALAHLNADARARERRSRLPQQPAFANELVDRSRRADQNVERLAGSGALAALVPCDLGEQLRAIEVHLVAADLPAASSCTSSAACGRRRAGRRPRPLRRRAHRGVDRLHERRARIRRALCARNHVELSAEHRRPEGIRANMDHLHARAG